MKAFFLVLLLLSGCWIFLLPADAQLPLNEHSTKLMLQSDIEYLSSDALEGREVGTEGERKAAMYIAERMDQLGLEPAGDGKSFYQEFTVNKSVTSNPHSNEITSASEGDESITGRNVLGMINNNADHTVIIGAHYDHLGYGGEGSLSVEDSLIHNGADDNASGVAGLLYLANRLQHSGKGYNYLFMAFSGEERGLWGSNYFTKNPTIDLSDANYMINMDMIGRLNQERALAINGTGTAPDWEETITLANTDSLKLVMKASGIGPSDHTSFYLQDIPVLQFFTGQHEDYHKPTDDADKINYAGMIEVLGLIGRVIEDLDDEDKLEFLVTQEDPGQTSMRSFKVTLGVIPDYLYDGEGMRIDGVKPDRPADNAGLVKGDIVMKMGDLSVTNMNEYMDALTSFEPGQEIIVIIKREDQMIERSLKFD